MSPDPIYVERLVEGPLDAVWERTQDPTQHERWDLRFSAIEYLPKAADGPQQFTYTTRIGFGLGVKGTGESVATNEDGRETTSVLAFESDQQRSLIREGRGFWRYVETEDGLRFLTEYNYDTAWGWPGRVIDRLAFRPLLAWATALSFDVLARWVEEGTPPETGFRLFATYALSRVGLAMLWIYQGLVPKLLAFHPAERQPLIELGLSGMAGEIVIVLGVLEIALGLALIARWQSSGLAYFAGLAAIPLTIWALIIDPALATGPFNPVVPTVAMAALGLIAGRLAGVVPTADNCLRSAPEE